MNSFKSVLFSEFLLHKNNYVSLLYSHQGLENYRKEPVLEPEPFGYWEPKPYRNQ